MAELLQACALLLVQGLGRQGVSAVIAMLILGRLGVLRTGLLVVVAAQLGHDSGGSLGAALRTDQGAEEVVGPAGQRLWRQCLTQVECSILRWLLVLRVTVVGSKVVSTTNALIQMHERVQRYIAA